MNKRYLLINIEDAKDKLTKQYQIGHNILKYIKSIKKYTSESRAVVLNKYKVWDDFNKNLLKSMFSDHSFAEDYENAEGFITPKPQNPSFYYYHKIIIEMIRIRMSSSTMSSFK